MERLQPSSPKSGALLPTAAPFVEQRFSYERATLGRQRFSVPSSHCSPCAVEQSVAAERSGPPCCIVSRAPRAVKWEISVISRPLERRLDALPCSQHSYRMVAIRRDWERRALRLRWAFIASLGVACAGRSISETRDGTGGTGGSHTPGAGGAGAMVGAGAFGGTVVSAGGAGGAGGTSVTPTPTGGRGGYSGEGGGSGPFPRGGVAGDLGGSRGDAGAGVDVGGTSGAGGKAGAGGTGGAVFQGGSGGDAGAPTNQFPCRKPQDWESSAVLCGDGFIHLPVRVACPVPSRDPVMSGAAGDAGGSGTSRGDCAGDADCASNEYCVEQADPNQGCSLSTNVCVRGCSVDADCAAGSICLCDTHTKAATGATFNFGTCVYAYCRADSECGGDFMCRAKPRGNYCGTGPSVFGCQSFADECGGEADCEADATCAYQDGTYVCRY